MQACPTSSARTPSRTWPSGRSRRPDQPGRPFPAPAPLTRVCGPRRTRRAPPCRPRLPCRRPPPCRPRRRAPPCRPRPPCRRPPPCPPCCPGRPASPAVPAVLSAAARRPAARCALRRPPCRGLGPPRHPPCPATPTRRQPVGVQSHPRRSEAALCIAEYSATPGGVMSKNDIKVHQSAGRCRQVRQAPFLDDEQGGLIAAAPATRSSPTWDGR